MITILDDSTKLCYMRVDKDGWYTTNPTFEELKELLGEQAETEIVYPLFPTVYIPEDDERAYYNAVLDNVKEGDKVLVVSCGSGSDTWLAWLKAKTMIYTIDINEQAILNTFAVAGIGGFTVKPLRADIRDMELPDDFKDFDCVLGAIPYMNWQPPLEQDNFHDGDDGSVTEAFMKLLPFLLKKGGIAVVQGTKDTEEYIELPMKKTEHGHFNVYVLGESS